MTGDSEITQLRTERDTLLAAYRAEAMRRVEYTHESFDAHVAAILKDQEKDQ